MKMKRFSYCLLFLLFPSNCVSSSEPNFCTLSNVAKCSSKNVTIHVIKDDKLLTTSPVTLSHKTGTHANIVCSDSQYKISVPLIEIGFWKNGDAMHLPSLSTFSKTESCVRINCQKDKVHLIVCLTKPMVPICQQDDKLNEYRESKLYQDTEIMIGEHILVVEAESETIEIECNISENQSNVSVRNDGTTDLAIYGNILHLVHKHSPEAVPNYIQSPKFCLYTDGDIGPMKASYCFPDQKIILEKSCRSKFCVIKCCQPGYIYNINSFSCDAAFHSGELWKPKFYDSSTQLESNESSVDYDLVIGTPHCLHFYQATSSDDIKLLDNGTLLIGNGLVLHPPGRYCIDKFINEKVILEEAFVCFEPESSPVQSTCSYIGQKIYPILLLISSGFLLLTIITYAMVPELHAKIQSKCLISSIVALLFAYLALALGQILSYLLSQTPCIILGIFIQFTVLSSFFWLNVMCFDIWSTLRSVLPSRDSSTNPRKKFLIYSLYGWGCPLIISSITSVMQFGINEKHHQQLYLPRIGETDCFFSANDPITRWIYLYSFISGILVLNIIFFIHLAVILVKAQHTSEVTLGQKGQQREWIKLYIKLFFVMGVSWLFEAVTWQTGQCGVWIATDIINALRGFFIFVIFVCKKDVFQKIKNRGIPLSQLANTIQSSLLKSSQKNSTKVDEPNVVGLLNTTHSTSLQNSEGITRISTCS